MVFDNSRSAIINGERVREGDEVEGATVLEIDLEGVRLRFNGEEFFLRMK
jgi:sRNA-binding protein